MAMQALLDAGLTKQAIAARLGVSRRTLTRWQSATETTPRKPRAMTVAMVVSEPM